MGSTSGEKGNCGCCRSSLCANGRRRDGERWCRYQKGHYCLKWKFFFRGGRQPVARTDAMLFDEMVYQSKCSTTECSELPRGKM